MAKLSKFLTKILKNTHVLDVFRHRDFELNANMLTVAFLTYGYIARIKFGNRLTGYTSVSTYSCGGLALFYNHAATMLLSG